MTLFHSFHDRSGIQINTLANEQRDQEDAPARETEQLLCSYVEVNLELADAQFAIADAAAVIWSVYCTVNSGTRCFGQGGKHSVRSIARNPRESF